MKNTGVNLANKKQLISLIGILLLVGFIATGFVSYYTTSDLYKKDLSENILPLTGDNIYSEVRKNIVELVLISSLMANDTYLKDWVIKGEHNTSLITKYLKTIQEKFHTVTCFFASDRTRAYYHPTGIFTTISEENPRDAWYFKVKAMEKEYDINLGIDNANKDSFTIFINYKVFDYDGKVLGVAGSGVTVKNIQDLFDDYAKRYQRKIYFVNQQHEVILANRITKPPFKNIKEVDGLKHIELSPKNTDPVTISYQRNHDTFLLNTRFIPEIGLYLFVEQSLKGANRHNIFMLLIKNCLITLLIGGVIIAAVYSTVNIYQSELVKLATTDKLTQLTNRHVFDIIFNQALRDAERNNRPITIILFDIDHFKKINDRYGHLAGDTVLIDVANTTREEIREADCLCRWGGEEFLVLLKGCTLKNGVVLAEQLRETIQDKTVYHDDEPISVKISLGVAQWQVGEENETLLQRADQALYKAKNNGRNRVETA